MTMAPLFAELEGRKEGTVLFNDAVNSLFMVIWHQTNGKVPQIVREETCCRHMGSSRGALAGTRNISMGPPRRIDPTTHCTMNERSYHGATSRSLLN